MMQPTNDHALSAILQQILNRSFQLTLSDSDSFTDWWRLHCDTINEWALPIDRAIMGGLLSDRLGFAFAAGFEAALRHLVPALPKDKIVAFCISEEKGPHPKYIRTQLKLLENKNTETWAMTGQKKWTTLACEADILLVATSKGETNNGQNLIQMVTVEQNLSGIHIQRMDSIEFIPEISHGLIQFKQVELLPNQLLSGDGYINYIKPFRTIEDTYNTTAILVYIFQVASKYEWPRSLQEEILHLITSFRSIALSDTTTPEIHIVLGGSIAHFRQLYEKIIPYWKKTDSSTRERWERDTPLFNIATQAHSLRLEAAWKQFH